MKQLLILTIFCLNFCTCTPSAKKKTELVDGSKSTKLVIGKKFFMYDSIDYYTNDIDESKTLDLYDNQSKSEIDSFKMGVILGDIPHSISDLAFIGKLSKLGYKKTIVEKSKFDLIDQIFAEKTTSENIATACIYVYRNILIFKKDSKVVGTAKVCFSCMANQIKGTNANTENFGQEGDYERLAKLLKQR